MKDIALRKASEGFLGAAADLAKRGQKEKLPREGARVWEHLGLAVERERARRKQRADQEERAKKKLAEKEAREEQRQEARQGEKTEAAQEGEQTGAKESSAGE